MERRRGVVASASYSEVSLLRASHAGMCEARSAHRGAVFPCWKGEGVGSETRRRLQIGRD